MNDSGKTRSCAPFAGRLGGELLELVDRRLAVEHDRLGLDAGDLDGRVHVASLRRPLLVAYC